MGAVRRVGRVSRRRSLRSREPETSHRDGPVDDGTREKERERDKTGMMRRDGARDARARRRTAFAFAFASALALASVRAAEGWTFSSDARDGRGRGRSLVDVTGSAFFDVFGFELSAGAVFDPVCEFLNPFLAPEHRLSACEQVAAEEAEEYAYEEPVAGVDEVQGTFVNGVTGNVAGGIGGGAIGGVAGGSAGFIGGGLGGAGGLGVGAIGAGGGAIGRR